MSSAILQRVQENYTVGAIGERVKQALENAGLGSGRLEWSDLVPFDQFHVRGLEASKELARDLEMKGEVKGGQTVLDVGSGLGGPARYLAAVHGVHVTGVELTPSFVEISDYLSERAGLTDRLTFRQGDATELPFADDSFDIVWTQHVAMNIADKAKLYKELCRVAKAGGRLAIYDPIRGNGQPILYPTPWAREEGISFVASEDEMRTALTEAGFSNLVVTDKSDSASQWFRELRAQREQQEQVGKAPGPLNPVFILGPEMGPAIANFGRNVLEGRVRIVQVVAQKHGKTK